MPQLWKCHLCNATCTTISADNTAPLCWNHGDKPNKMNKIGLKENRFDPSLRKNIVEKPNPELYTKSLTVDELKKLRTPGIPTGENIKDTSGEIL